MSEQKVTVTEQGSFFRGELSVTGQGPGALDTPPLTSRRCHGLMRRPCAIHPRNTMTRIPCFSPWRTVMYQSRVCIPILEFDPSFGFSYGGFGTKLLSAISRSWVRN